jgi:hypothetical protein
LKRERDGAGVRELERAALEVAVDELELEPLEAEVQHRRAALDGFASASTGTRFGIRELAAAASCVVTPS